jgi:Lrp/AsnC family leucine-responsive transcriptional regulator
MIDDIDKQILSMLQANARVSNAEIARCVEMAPSAVLERIRKLEERGIVREYTARLEPQELGLGLLAFIFVRTKAGTWQENTAERLAELSEVEEVHHITGEDCFLVKVRVKDPNALGALLRDGIDEIDSVSGTRTTVVLESVKETTRVCLDRVICRERGRGREVKS